MGSPFAVCVPVHEAARPYFASFAAALAAAAKPHDARILMACDGAAGGINGLRSVLGGLRVDLVAAPPGSTPADVRRLLLGAARQVDADMLIFSDCDDELQPDALGSHACALERAGFSYGDQILVDAEGRAIGSTLYERWDVPATAVTIAPLLNGNFVGFSGSAMRRSVLAPEITAVPSSTRAVDWWVFSRLLLAGSTGRRTDRPVVRYRQHPGNVHGGAIVSPALPEVRRRAAVAAVHFENLPDHPEVVRRRAATRHLLDVLDSAAEPLMPAIESACRQPACWYADVMALALGCAGRTRGERS